MLLRFRRVARRTTLIYLAVAATWILVSGRVVSMLSQDAATLEKLERFKGWFFVIVTSGLLYVGLRRQLGQTALEASERQRATSALAEAEERQRLFIEHAPAALAMFDREMRYIAASQRWVDDYGLNGRKILGVSHYEVFPEIPERWKTIHRRGLSGEVVRAEADEFKRHDGRSQWLRWEVRPWRAADGNVGGILVFSEDITARLETERKLRASEARYRLLAENVSDVVWVLDAATMRLMYVSPSVERLRGYTAAEVLQEPLEASLTSESMAMLRNSLPGRIDAFLAGDLAAVAQKHEVEQYHRDGSRIWVEAATTLVRTAECGVEVVGVSRDISARRQAEMALRESEERFRAVVETSPMAIFIQTGGRFAYFNHKTEELFAGAGPQDLHGQVVSACIHPDSRDALVDRFRHVNRGQARIAEAEYAVQRQDGSVAFIALSAVPFTYRGTEGALVFGRDVTEAKRATERLRLHEATLRETGEIAKVGGWSFDPDTGAGYWTDEVARIHGLNPDDHASLEIGLGFYAAESRERIESAIRNAVDRGVSYDLQLELIAATGEHKWVRTIGHPMIENGKVVRVRGSFQDVTELHKAGAALRESEERFRQIAENINEVFWIRDVVADRLIYVSPAFDLIWGRDRAELLRGDLVWSNTIHPDDVERVVDRMHDRQSRGDFDEIYRILLPSGELRWIHDRAFPIPDSRGRVYRVIGTAEDITERRKLEEQFRHAQKMQAIGTLAGGIAHDFNNLLGAINGFAELAGLQVKDPEVAEYLHDIRMAGKRAAGLVRQILAFSRRSSSERVVMQLRPILDEAQRLLRATLPTTIEIDVRLGADIWPVRADPTQVNQVLMNLGTNAWHAMRDKVGRLEMRMENIEVGGSMAEIDHRLQPGPYVRISVSDTGCGMDALTMERAFEPFFTTKAPGEGTGLGLSVVHGIMQEHHGAVTVTSVPGEGTVFHLYFPAIKEAADYRDDALARARRGEGERVLFVDDEAPLVRLGRRMLREIGYDADGAHGVVEALSLLRNDPGRYAVVITDQTMPGMTGVEFFHEMRRMHVLVPVILVTGYSATLTVDRVRELGMADLLLKPLTLERLGEVVQDALKQARKPS